MSNACKTRNYTCLTKVFSKRQYWTSFRYHLVLIGTGNFGGQMLMLKDSPVGFNTYALNCKYFVPSSSEHIVICCHRFGAFYFLGQRGEQNVTLTSKTMNQELLRGIPS